MFKGKKKNKVLIGTVSYIYPQDYLDDILIDGMKQKLPTKPIVDLFYTHVAPHLPSSKKPILINLHGFLGSKTMFRSINRSIAQTLNTDIYTVDLRNHGDSPQAHPMTYSALSTDMLHFIDTKLPSDRQIDILGYSMGGKVAMMLALNKNLKDRVRKVVSIDMPPYVTSSLPVELTTNWELIKQIASGHSRIKRGGIQWRNKIIDLLGLYFGSGFLQEECNYISKNNKQINYYLPVEEFPNMLEELKDWKIDENMVPSNNSTKILFLRALKSCLIDSNYDLVRKVFPNSKVEEYATTHNLIFEDYEKSITSILNFLKN